MNEFKLDCGHCSLASLCMPLGLTSDELDHLSRMAIEPRNLKPHELLFRSGQPFVNLFAIRSGSFKAVMTTSGGSEHVVDFYLPGEWIGLHAIHRERFLMNAIALETSSVCVIPYNELTTLAQTIPALQQYLLSIMSERLHPERFVDPNSTAENRITRLLFSLSQRYSRRGYSAREFRLSMSREDIGHYLGLATETVSRIFTQLDHQKIIDIDRREVKLLDLEQLQLLMG